MTRLPSLGPRGEGWVLVQGILFVLIVAAGFSVNGAWAREARTVTTIVAGLLGVAGVVLAVSGVMELRGAFTPLPRPREGAQLVDTGPFRLVRHPVYGGIAIAALAWGIFTASPVSIGLALLLLAFFRLKSAREEAWLDEAYPGYGAYRARTKRMLPYLY
jgi:protein-S-isoprenylcysteine O-methyltransferase Ste14